MNGTTAGALRALLALGAVSAVAFAGLAAWGRGAEVAAVPAPAAEPAPPSAAPDRQPVTLRNTEVRHLRSRVNGVGYTLQVGLPPGYGAPGERYPVVYLLDADYSFALAKNVTDHLAERGDLAELLLVGIAYDPPLRYRLNRTRDYTPSAVTDLPPGLATQEPYQRVSGGGPAFRRFLAEELVPFVDREYATRPADRTLVGHSYGALFGAWVLTTTPGLFQRFLLVSPSLWYDDRFLLRQEASEAAGGRRLDARVFLAVGSREGNRRRDMVGDTLELAAALRAPGRGVAVEAQVLEGETHNTVFPHALAAGLRHLFDGR